MANKTGHSLLGMLVLFAVLGIMNCDVFVPDRGTETMPCLEDNDCVDKLACFFEMCVDTRIHCEDSQPCMEKNGFESFCLLPENVCIPWDPNGYGTCCEDGDCWGVAERCEFFLKDQELPHCVNSCDPQHEAEACKDVPGTATCMVTESLDRVPVCGRVAWTDGFGVFCDPENPTPCPYGNMCVVFHAMQAGLCTNMGCSGKDECPAEMECHDVPLQPPGGNVVTACGFPNWHGFWMNCGTDDECANYPGFPICPAGNCTRPCGSGCPKGANCHPDGHCVPD